MIMGLFNLFNKKTNNVAVNNFNPLSANSIIEYYKSKNPNATDKDVLKFMQSLAQPDKDQEHLTSEGKLPWGWLYKNKDFTDKIESENSFFLNNTIDTEKQSPMEHLAALKSYVTFLNDAHNLCHSKGECFAYWFDGCVADSEYIQKETDKLKTLELNIDELQRKYEIREKEMKDIDEKIISRLKENNGILQSDFIKLFDPTVQTDVKGKLYYMDKNGQIKRTKSGRSYILNI